MTDWDNWDVPDTWNKRPLDKYLERNDFDTETVRYIQ
jgi:hypothetical protein